MLPKAVCRDGRWMVSAWTGKKNKNKNKKKNTHRHSRQKWTARYECNPCTQANMNAFRNSSIATAGNVWGGDNAEMRI